MKKNLFKHHVDKVNSDCISGWVMNLENLSQPVKISFVQKKKNNT